jgi:5-methyltetrahydrofolate--homocysteine methyltransferase
MLVIGERINSSRRPIAEAVESRDAAFIRNEAKAQADAGADYVDVNAGTFVGEEADRLKWIVETVQGAVDQPLCIDSPDPQVIRAVLPLLNDPPMINSISLEPARLEGILPLVAQHQTKVIALCQSEGRMAESLEEKMEMAHQLETAVTAAGIGLQDLYIDPLIFPLATNHHSALASLNAVEAIMAELPGVHTTCGLTNVSYGMPNRRLLNQTFLVSAVTRGLDSVIMDPTDNRLFGSLKAAMAVAGKDEFCLEYVGAYREGRLE